MDPFENLKTISARCFYKKKTDFIPVLPANLEISDISDKSDSDNENLEDDVLRLGSNDADDVNPLPCSSRSTVEVIQNNSSSSDGSDDEEIKPIASKRRKKSNRRIQKADVVYNWVEEDLPNFEKPTSDVNFGDDNYHYPLQYFLEFFSYECIELIVKESNLYCTQMTGKSLDTDNKEVTNFIAILIYMGVISLPSYKDYWSATLRIESIANVMSLRRFKQLRRYIHFNDNSLVGSSQDRFYKIRPLLDIVNRNCSKFEIENRFSIDETMVPYKGTRAGNLRQYMKNKPHKWGYKFFMRAGVSGLIYSFIPYQGKNTFSLLDGTAMQLAENELAMGVGSSVVIALTKTIQNPAHSIVYFDNYFSSVNLFLYLKHRFNIYSLGTLRNNRLNGCQLISDKELLKKGRGKYDYKSTNRECIIVKWADNKCVLIGSTIHGVSPENTLRRYCKEKKGKTNIPCPSIIMEYNRHMGGVDKSNSLVGLYRTPGRAKRWYFPIFAYIIDMCIVNAWLLYKENNKNEKKCMPLKEFRCDIAKGLSTTGKPKPGRPVSSPKSNSIIIHPVVPRPSDVTRKDTVGHWPVHTTKGRCRMCTTGFSRIMCRKCMCRLCLNDKNNCFVHFHL
ncbi:unnamed protein product [Acanthoscelides obtectus]|uniref:PiggyBac transposable element-derived protein domain-containing protein n=1 Tax=Acanthoscelides obtectus TaxID=200917 RepID=A0A9P0K5X0_ACAOB|nr:unnamed protein product [Acanthoscelides obtectus]CAK1622917.1 PiggyBac transposable element-derived protein 3 [Acanthoscelides obtectus]